MDNQAATPTARQRFKAVLARALDEVLAQLLRLGEVALRLAVDAALRRLAGMLG